MPRGNVCLFIAIVVSVKAQTPREITDEIREGALLQSQGRFPEAELRLQSAVSKASAIHALPDLQATALSNLASVQFDQGRSIAAVRSYEQALRILEEQAPESVDRITTLQTQIAELYLEAGQVDTARRLLRRLVDSPGFNVGSAPSGVAYALDVLACVYLNLKKYAAAETEERRALSVIASIKDPDPANAAISTMHLSIALNLQNKPAEALPYARRALEMQNALVLPQPAMRGAAEMNLASIYSRVGQPQEAKAESRNAIAIVEHYYGERHHRTGQMLIAQAAIMRAIGQKEEARAAQKRAEAILGSRPDLRLDNTVPVTALFPK